MVQEQVCSLIALEEAVARSLADRLGSREQAQRDADRDPKSLRQAAVAMVLGADPADPAPHLLLMHRTEHPQDRWSGHISLPGGHVEADDASLLAAAMREAREEVGIPLEPTARLLGALPAIQASGRGKLLAMRVTPFVFALTRPTEARPGPEAQSVFALPLDRAASGALDAPYRVPAADGPSREVPSFRYGHHTVWGMTYRMIQELLAALREP
ncbi:MAG TPA: CoA pyrophosphatase [Planctomycetes bacterium]|nr:CoA pyrophosphatase [Planctomycetota bacterium]